MGKEIILSAADFFPHMEFSPLEFYYASFGKFSFDGKVTRSRAHCEISLELLDLQYLYIYWSSKFEDHFKVNDSLVPVLKLIHFLDASVQLHSFIRILRTFSSLISHAVEFFTRTFPKIIYHMIAKYINSRVMKESFLMRKTASFDM